MARIRFYGVQSEGPLITSTGFTIITPTHAGGYFVHAFKGTPEPVITVSGASDLTSVYAQYDPDLDKPDATLYACAVPSGSTGPSTVGELVSSYVSYQFGGMRTFLRLSDTVSLITSTQATPGSATSTRNALSGNAVYNVYCGYAISILSRGTRKIVTFGDLHSQTLYRTYAPYPHANAEDPDFTVSIADIGEMVSGFGLQQFTFSFKDAEDIYNFDELSRYNYTVYPGPTGTCANSGFVQMTCYGVNSGVYWRPTFVGGTAELVSGWMDNGGHAYLMPNSGSITWSVPKFFDNGAKAYERYKFGIKYINSSGTLSPPLDIEYNEDSLKSIHNKEVSDAVGEKLSDEKLWQGPIPINVKPLTHRKRLAIGVQDIDLQSIEYKDRGSHISKMYGSEEPIYAVSLDVTEQMPQAGDAPAWDFVKYYVQFGSVESDEWIRISPKSRVNEVDDEGNYVPNILILDSQMTDNDKQSLTDFSTVKFVDHKKAVYTLRVKTEINTINSPSRGLWSPFVYDYKIMVVNRSVLSSANVERYLFK